MNKINMGRVLLGGLFAGLVINIGEYLFNGVLFAKAMEESNQRLGLPPVGGAFIVRAVVLTFLAGIVLVYLYAAIRPRFGAGVQTAICAGLIMWFFVYVYCGLLIAFAGFSPMNLAWIGIVWGIVEIPLGAVVGAYFYKE